MENDEFLNTYGGEGTRGRMLIFTDFDKVRLKEGYVLTDKIRGIMWGTEVCPTSGKKHNQGYVQFFAQTRFTGAMKELNTKCWMKVANGTPEDNEKYCSKDGKFTKLGSFCTQGQKLSSIFENYENGNTLLDIAQNDEKLFLKHHSGITKIYEMLDEEKYSNLSRSIDSYIIWGDTNVGKSTSIINKYGRENCYTIQDPEGDNKYWNNYNGQDVIIFDDFYSWIKLGVMLCILNPEPYRCRALGRTHWARWTKVYITSNQNPEEWYIETQGEKRKAFFRRFKKCLEVCKGNNGTLHTYAKVFETNLGNQEYVNIDKHLFPEKDVSI